MQPIVTDMAWSVLGGGWIPKETGNFVGRSIQQKPKLFGRWQQQCSLSLSVLPQFVSITT